MSIVQARPPRLRPLASAAETWMLTLLEEMDRRTGHGWHPQRRGEEHDDPATTRLFSVSALARPLERCRRRLDLLNDRSKPIDIGVPRLVAHRNRVAARERLHVLGHLRRGRHRRAFDQDGHDKNVGPREARGYLEADEVEWIFQPPAPGCVACIEPLAADDDQHHLADGEARFDGFDEILTRLQRVDVAKQLPAEPPLERFVQTPGVSGGVVASEADERTGHAARGDSTW
jgi:hypothetical protein